jgi:hypothetical protein
MTPFKYANFNHSHTIENIILHLQLGRGGYMVTLASTNNLAEKDKGDRK